ETEYAEDRIRKLAPQVAESLMAESAESQGPALPPDLLPLLPAVEKVVLRTAEHDWNPSFDKGMLKIMGSQDEVNRATAMTLLSEHPDAKTEKQVFQLLDDPDVFKRGMAGYVALKWRSKRAIPIVRKWLDDPAELVRFDAVSALLEAGGPEGRKLLQEYAASGKEQNAQLRALLSEALSK